MDIYVFWLGKGKTMKVLIADAHTLFREGFSRQLQRFEALTELQEVTDYSSIGRLADQKKTFDLIFVDKDVLGTDWKEKFQSVKTVFPQARVVLMSENEERNDIIDAFDIGAVGYIPKQSPDLLIINALHLIVDGNSYIPPAILKGLKKSAKTTGESKIISHTLPNGKNLTYRQSEVLQHLSNGLSNKQIAYEMNVSEATVKLHINALLRHLHVENRTKAVVTAQRLGILET